VSTLEVNFDGLVGPTHNYAGLAFGNVASQTHRAAVSNPREAALQGLAKMWHVAELGLPQALLPPHERPAVGVLRELGFTGGDAAVLARAAREAPALLAACASASAMWTANAATVAPSADAGDARLHVTPANLVSTLHRAIEPRVTARILHAIFPDPDRFTVHPPLAGGAALADEGAANHTRLAPAHDAPGVHLFVYGRSAFRTGQPRPARYPARHTLEASAAVARRHRLVPGRVCFAQQHPAAIDAGVFHNDVIAVGNEGVFLYHEEAFVDTEAVIAELAARYRACTERELCAVAVSAREMRVEEAVASYLFNSQLVSLPGGGMALIAPQECAEHPKAAAVLARIAADSANPIGRIDYLALRQSMWNGGGPACLRLRVVLSEPERAALPAPVFLTEGRHDELAGWVRRHYRDRLTQADLADPALLDESRAALDELTRMLALGSVYDFQRAGA